MSEYDRRDVLKRSTSVALIASGVYATSGAASAADGSPQSADERARSDGFDGDALEPAWEYDRSHTAPSIVDGTVYTGTGSDVYDAEGTAALDAEDGSIEWETDAVYDEPTVVGDSLYQLSQGELYALDRADGSVRWRIDFDPDGPGLPEPAVDDDTVYVSTFEKLYALATDDGSVRWEIDIDRHDGPLPAAPTVAHGAVYLVIDGGLYAFETDDGSRRWDRESDVAVGFSGPPTASNGLVYAASGPVYAFDPETGAEEWSIFHDTAVNLFGVTSTALGVVSGSTIRIYDLETREEIASVPWSAAVADQFALGDEIAVGTRGSEGPVIGIDLETGDEVWELPDTYSSPVLADDTVYFHGTEELGETPEVIALDKYDGTKRWSAPSGNGVRHADLVVGDETILVKIQGRIRALRETSTDAGDGNGDECDCEGGEDDARDHASNTDSDGTGNESGTADDGSESDGTESDGGGDGDSGDGDDESDAAAGDGAGETDDGSTEVSSGDDGADTDGTGDSEIGSDGSGDDADSADDTPGFGVVTGLAATAGGAAIAARRLVSSESADPTNE